LFRMMIAIERTTTIKKMSDVSKFMVTAKWGGRPGLQ
jgi:hypothetical protein